MTLREKIALCEGKNFWETREYPQYGIPSMFMCDGPHGLRKQEHHSDHLGVHKSRPPPVSCISINSLQLGCESGREK